MTEERTALVVIPHADDLAFFCAGLVAMWADAGWRIVLVRVTNDDKDSVGLSREETVARNRAELEQAAEILGVSEIVELDYVTDTLGDASETELRERFIRLIRSTRPYATLSFDQYSVLFEDNQDHIAVARAMDEACWASMFDKHHPEHLDDGLQPHGVFERWYFGRRLLETTTAIDISPYIDRKTQAVAAHTTMVAHILHQLRLQAETAGVTVPALTEAKRDGPDTLVAAMVRGSAAAAGKRHGLAFAEEYRVHRFSGFEALLPPDAREAPEK